MEFCELFFNDLLCGLYVKEVLTGEIEVRAVDFGGVVRVVNLTVVGFGVGGGGRGGGGSGACSRCWG